MITVCRQNPIAVIFWERQFKCDCLDGVLVPYIDVPTEARAYLKAIRQIVPSGPYQLLGHSFDGWVAFEIARQPTAAGEQVPTLVLLDAEAPSSFAGQRKQYCRVEMLMKLVELFELRSGQSLTLSDAAFAELSPVQQLSLMLNGISEAVEPYDKIFG